MNEQLNMSVGLISRFDKFVQKPKALNSNSLYQQQLYHVEKIIDISMYSTHL